MNTRLRHPACTYVVVHKVIGDSGTSIRVAVADVITGDICFADWSRRLEFVGGGSKISGFHRQSLSLLIVYCLCQAASENENIRLGER